MTNPGELSPLDHEIAAALRAQQPRYRFQPFQNHSQLSRKIFLATVGPIGSGKATLTNEIIRLAPEFTPADTHTTRARRPSDLEHLQTANEGVTHLFMNNAIINRTLVNYSVSRTDHIYATAPEDMGDYTIGQIEHDSIENFMTAELKDFYPVFLVARGALYQQRLEQERTHALDMKKQLVKAMGSLLFARLNIEAPWFAFIETGESAEELEAAGRDVVRMTYQRTYPNMTTEHKLQLLSEMENAVQNVGRQLR